MPCVVVSQPSLLAVLLACCTYICSAFAKGNEPVVQCSLVRLSSACFSHRSMGKRSNINMAAGEISTAVLEQALCTLHVVS